MSRRLPVLGSASASEASAQSSVASTLRISTLMSNGAPVISVLGASSAIEVSTFMTRLAQACEQRGVMTLIERSSELPSTTALLVIIGSHVPRMSRHPEAQALWERADLLLSADSTFVAQALAAAV